MTRSVNKVIIVGRLGADPEQRRTQSGLLVVNCNVATDERWTDQDSNERKERTEWHRVVFFGRLAEIVGQYLRKGSLVYVEGRLQTRKWQDSRTGQDRYSTEIIAREMVMLDSRGEGRSESFGGSRASDYNQSSGADSGSRTSQPVSSGSSSDFPEDPAEDIPW